MNEILAHTPWKMNEQISEFIRKQREEDVSDAWTEIELLHASLIFCTYHSICSLVMGQGIIDDLDIPLPMLVEEE